MPASICRLCSWSVDPDSEEPGAVLEAETWLAAHPLGVCQGPGRSGATEAVPGFAATVVAVRDTLSARRPRP